MQKNIKITCDQRPFVMVYWDFLESKLLDWNEKRVFIILKKFADSDNQCFPSVQTICQLSQLSKNTVKKALRSLEAKNIIKIEYREDKEKNKHQSNLYTLYDYPELWSTEDVETINSTVDIEELRLFELAKKKGYKLEKEPETLQTNQKNNDSDSNTNTIDIKKDNTNESKSQERYTLNQIHQLFDYDTMLQDHPKQQSDIDSVMNVLQNVMNTSKPTIRIAGQDKPTMIVIGKLMKLDKNSIFYAIDKFAEQKERIKNPAAYMLTILYHAPEQYYLDHKNQASYNKTPSKQTFEKEKNPNRSISNQRTYDYDKLEKELLRR